MIRRWSKEALGLLDVLPCGHLQTAEDGTIRHVNRTFCNWVGQSPETLIEKKRFQDLLTMGGRIFHHTHWAPLLSMQGSISEVKLDFLGEGDTKIPMLINALRRDDDGTVVHEISAHVAHDRDKYERELIRSRQRLEELVAEATRLQAEAKDRALFAEQMMGIVSHDLRNPLSVITMGAGLLASEKLSEGQQRTVTRIIRAAERSSRLIGDLLDFTQARLGSGLSVTREKIDLHTTIAETLDELAHVHSARRLEHVKRGPGTCLADPNRILQLVGNLVSNAATYGDPYTPITVTTSIEHSDASIAVHNGGTPIPPHVHETIFDPMTRGSDEGRGRRSVGLGLFIVREIAKAHGGKATVESSAEQGTTFCVTFRAA